MKRAKLSPRVAGIIARLVVVALVVVGFWSKEPQAHKPITSPYTYNEHAYPIFRDRCGYCHVDGGPTPMSLLSYQEAKPWAESILLEVTHQRMPPWYAGRGAAGGNSLTARELDTLLTWAAGGAPEGRPEDRPEPTTVRNEWMLGPPDLLIPIPEYTLPQDQRDHLYEVVVPGGLYEMRWLRAVDLRPGTPQLVRSARIILDQPGKQGTVLRIWQPGEPPSPVPEGTGFKLAEGSQLRVQIRYKRPWYIHTALSDSSSVGLYFAEQTKPGGELQALQLKAVPTDGRIARHFRREVPTDVKALAVLSELDQPYESIAIEALLPGGSRTPLLTLSHPRPEWDRRYWLAHPLDLPQGARLEAIATPERQDSEVSSQASEPAATLPQITIYFVYR